MRKSAIICIVIACLMAGCLPVPHPQKGGAASSGPIPTSVAPTGTVTQGSDRPTLGMPQSAIAQSENPNSTSAQSVDYEYEEVTIVPLDTVKETTTNYPDGRSVTVKEPQPAGTKTIKRAKSNVNQQLGGSWKDTAREVSAALGSFKAVQYAGIAFLLIGAVAFCHPALRALIGGKDTAMVVGGCGIVMMFGPYLFVTYSKWFFLAILVAACYWFISRLKYKEGLLDAKPSP